MPLLIPSCTHTTLALGVQKLAFAVFMLRQEPSCRWFGVPSPRTSCRGNGIIPQQQSSSYLHSQDQQCVGRCAKGTRSRTIPMNTPNNSMSAGRIVSGLIACVLNLRQEVPTMNLHLHLDGMATRCQAKSACADKKTAYINGTKTISDKRCPR